MDMFDLGSAISGTIQRNSWTVSGTGANRDNRTVYTVKKGQMSNLVCSFSYKPMTAKAKQYQSRTYQLRSKITNVKNSGLTYKEKQKKLQKLKCELQYVSGKLSREMDRIPLSGFIVREEGDE